MISHNSLQALEVDSIKKINNINKINQDEKFIKIYSIFNKLNKEDIEKIYNINLKSLSKKLKIKFSATLKISNDLKEKVLKEGFDPFFGARPLRRAIQTYIENEVAKYTLSHPYKENSTIEMDIKNNEIIVTSYLNQ
jgi:ATP-dependent Clp protease ATP-binding subunit ClpA